MAEVKNPQYYQIEKNEHPAIGVHHEAEMARVAAAVTAAAHEEQQFTKIDEDEFNARPWDVSYAFAQAVIDVLGQPLKGKTVSAGMFGGTILPGMHNFTIQVLVYGMPNGERMAENEIEALPLPKLVSLAEHVGSYVPQHYSANDREDIFDAVIKMLEIVGVADYSIRIPYGNVTLSYMAEDIGAAVIGAKEDPDLGLMGQLTIEVQNKNVALARSVLNRTKEVLARKSIYRGRCIDSADDRPRFWSPFKEREEKLVLSDILLRSIQTNIMYPIKWRERALRRDPSLLKRSFVWSGDYGTGKSMTMVLMAQWAIKNGWTVVRHKAGSDDLAKTMQLARIMEPCLVLVEDAEVFASSNDKEKISKLLDDFDGMLAKSGQVISIMTTNHEDQITKGMTRPGRVDALMRFGELDDDATMRLVINMLGEHTVEERIPSGLYRIEEKPHDYVPPKMTWEDRQAFLHSVRGYTGAFLAETVKRSMLATLDRERALVSVEDLIIAADSLREQFEVFRAAGEPEHKDTLDEAMKDAYMKAFDAAFNEGIVKVQMDTREGTFAIVDK